MNQNEHIKESERILASVRAAVQPYPLPAEELLAIYARAQVHATLAVALAYRGV